MIPIQAAVALQVGADRLAGRSSLPPPPLGPWQSLPLLRQVHRDERNASRRAPIPLVHIRLRRRHAAQPFGLRQGPRERVAVVRLALNRVPPQPPVVLLRLTA